jgi:hypothetical protein
MIISLSPNQARNITARSGLLPGGMRRPIQKNEIKNRRSDSRLPPFAETSDK